MRPLLLTVLASCATTLAVPTKPWPISIVTPVVTKSANDCVLPDLPAQPIIVGWPTPERVYVSKSDLVDLLTFQSILVAWAHEATKCLVGNQGAATEPK